MCHYLTILTVALAAQGPGVDLESLRNVMDGLRQDLRDVEFVYEGGVWHAGGQEDSPPMLFQGEFAYRTDGSAHINLYKRQSDERIPLKRQIFCLSNTSKLEQLDFHPDLGKNSKPLKATHGGLPSLDLEASPLRIFLAPILLEYLRDSGGLRTNNNLNYKYIAWEDVDGHRCLKVRIASSSVSGTAPVTEDTYWIDLERNGNPLKHEFRFRGDLWARAENIELGAFSLPSGGSFWLPVRGEYRSFLVMGKRDGEGKPLVTSEATSVETYKIVNDTGRINQNLPDKRFRIEWSAAPKTPGMKAAQAEHDEIVPQPRHTSAQARISDFLADADTQSRELDASAPSREFVSWTMVGTVALSIIGVLCLAFAWFLGRGGQ